MTFLSCQFLRNYRQGLSKEWNFNSFIFYTPASRRVSDRELGCRKRLSESRSTLSTSAAGIRLFDRLNNGILILESCKPMFETKFSLSCMRHKGSKEVYWSAHTRQKLYHKFLAIAENHVHIINLIGRMLYFTAVFKTWSPIIYKIVLFQLNVKWDDSLHH